MEKQYKSQSVFDKRFGIPVTNGIEKKNCFFDTDTTSFGCVVVLGKKLTKFGSISMKSERPLRVLHMPVSIRWIMDATIKGQTELGIETEKFLISSRGIDNTKGERFYYTPRRDPNGSLKVYFKAVFDYFKQYWKLLKWADVVHWQYCNRLWSNGGILKNLDFLLPKLLNKPVIAQFHGMDFLNNREWAKISPWWLESFDPAQMEGFTQLAETTQKEFSEAGIHFAMGFGMYPSVAENNRATSHILERAVDVSAIKPRKDYSDHERVLIVHGPSAPQKKGTKYVLDAIKEIEKIRDIDFKLLVDMEHDEVLESMRGADIAIDQLLCGDYGVFSVESMASGAAVVANICEELQQAYPEDLPIASANPLTIKDTLLRLIDDREERVARGKAGPGYAYRVHSIQETAPEILRIYRKVALAKGKTATVKRIDYHLNICKKKGWKGISDGK